VPEGPWNWQQACAWYIWRDLRVVGLVAPKDGDDDDTLTVEGLLQAQKKALRPSWYKWSRTDRTVRGAGFVMYQPRSGEVCGPSFLTEMLPKPFGSIAGFERAVAKGQVTESEFHTFDPAEMMRVFPSPDRIAAETAKTNATHAREQELPPGKTITAPPGGLVPLGLVHLQPQAETGEEPGFPENPVKSPLGVACRVAGGEPVEEKEPLRREALDDALDEWALVEWGADLTKLPPREELLSLARKLPKFSHVTQPDIRALRQRRAPDDIKRGGARMHRRS
jgi:hypothetical protein